MDRLADLIYEGHLCYQDQGQVFEMDLQKSSTEGISKDRCGGSINKETACNFCHGQREWGKPTS